LVIENSFKIYNLKFQIINHMCLAIPGKILKIKGDVAEIDFNGIGKTVNVALVDVKIGDFVMVHAGFAIEKMDTELVRDIQGYLGKK